MALLLALAVGSSSAAGGSWNLTFVDDFDTLDPAKWMVAAGGVHGANELELYVHPSARPAIALHGHPLLNRGELPSERCLSSYHMAWSCHSQTREAVSVVDGKLIITTSWNPMDCVPANSSAKPGASDGKQRPPPALQLCRRHDSDLALHLLQVTAGASTPSRRQPGADRGHRGRSA